METVHRTVLLNEAIDGLNLKEGSIYFDGTLGGAGHLLKVCSDFNGKVRVVATDRDEGAIKRAKEKLLKINCKSDIVNSDYKNIDIVLKNLNIEKVDAILIDLGLSTDQLITSGRGFSFKNNEPLLMTFSEKEERVTAEIVVNNWSEENIANIIYAYSDEKFSRKIARGIVEARKIKPIKTTYDLVEVISGAVPGFYKRGKIHFATKTFQALRICVNDEITSLKEGMQKGWGFLNKEGRMAIISFHSVEDREVKNFFRDMSKEKVGKLINKKPITPSSREVYENPASRSAKLRIIEKIN